MDRDQTQGVTTWLDRVNGGEAGAFAALVDAVYDDLKKIAGRRMIDRFDAKLAGLTVQTTSIVHDAVIELRRQRMEWKNSDQFFAVAARLIDRLITGYQRHSKAKKRGGGKRGVSLDQSDDAMSLPDDAPADQFPAILEALQQLHAEYPRKAEVVTLHVICEHSLPKVAQIMGLTVPQAERDWAFARKWLKRELADESEPQ